MIFLEDAEEVVSLVLGQIEMRVHIVWGTEVEGCFPLVVCVDARADVDGRVEILVGGFTTDHFFQGTGIVFSIDACHFSEIRLNEAVAGVCGNVDAEGVSVFAVVEKDFHITEVESVRCHWVFLSSW